MYYSVLLHITIVQIIQELSLILFSVHLDPLVMPHCLEISPLLKVFPATKIRIQYITALGILHEPLHASYCKTINMC